MPETNNNFVIANVWYATSFVLSALNSRLGILAIVAGSVYLFIAMHQTFQRGK